MFDVRCSAFASLRPLSADLLCNLNSQPSTLNLSGRLHRRGREARRGFLSLPISASSAVNLLNSQPLRAFDVRRSMFDVRSSLPSGLSRLIPSQPSTLNSQLLNPSSLSAVIDRRYRSSLVPRHMSLSHDCFSLI